MNELIMNNDLCVSVSLHGAEMQSIHSKSGKEFLWQGDPSIWSGRAPNLFPFVGRLTDGKYLLDGKEYTMQIHGLARYADFLCVENTGSAVEMAITSDDKMLEQYPRKFRFSVRYELEGSKIHVTYKVENLDEKTMIFGLGGHPGFFVPMDPERSFEDYVIEFPEKCTPKRVVFSDRALADHLEEYPLEEGCRLPLRHNLFDLDAVVLTEVPHKLRITCGESLPAVAVEFPGMDYVGFWHKPRTNAPYICVEPWVTLPGNEHEPTVFEEKKDLLSLEPGGVYVNNWSISIEE